MTIHLAKYILRALDEDKILEHTHMFKETKESGDLRQILKFQSRAIKQIQDAIESMNTNLTDRIDVKFSQFSAQIRSLQMNAIPDPINEEKPHRLPAINYSSMSADLNIPSIGPAGNIADILKEFLVGSKSEISLRNWCWEWSQCDKNRQKYQQRRYIAELYLKYVLEDKHSGKATFLLKYGGDNFGKARVKCMREYVAKYGKLGKRLK